MRLAPRLLLAFSSLCLAVGGALHAQAFPKAATVAEHSTLPPFFSAAFNGLWICDSITSVALALAFGSIAAFPGMASRSLVLLLALAPLVFATAIFATDMIDRALTDFEPFIPGASFGAWKSLASSV